VAASVRSGRTPAGDLSATTVSADRLLFRQRKRASVSGVTVATGTSCLASSGACSILGGLPGARSVISPELHVEAHYGVGELHGFTSVEQVSGNFRTLRSETVNSVCEESALALRGQCCPIFARAPRRRSESISTSWLYSLGLGKRHGRAREGRARKAQRAGREAAQPGSASSRQSRICLWSQCDAPSCLTGMGCVSCS
jgi:hypothetical protein